MINRATEDFLKDFPSGPMFCPDVKDECWKENEWGFVCPHHATHDPNTMCRHGVCPLTQRHLRCEEVQKGEAK
jgi:hypothetical protein